MLEWSLLVGFVRAAVFAAAHLCGNSIGSGILAVSVVVRLALLPITLRAARRAMVHQARLAELKPALDRLREIHGGDRAALADATARLYQKHGIEPLPRGAVTTMLIQLPIGAAMCQAFSRELGPRIGFLWIGDLARPDALLALLASALAGLTVSLNASGNSRSAIVASSILTLVIAWRLSASVALYWIASSGVGTIQSVLLNRRPANEPLRRPR